MAHLKSGNSPDVRPVERNHHRAAFDAAHPMWAVIVEDLQTIRGPGEATPDARMVGGLTRRQQHAHHRAASRNDDRAPSSAWTRTSSGVALPPISADVRL